MVWDQTQPTDTTKIRNLGIVIRPNWQAIQEGDSTFKPYALNFDNRTPLGVANDPTAIADSYIMYCKDDGSGNAEMFGIDENSLISQFTSTDRTLAQTGYTLLPPGFLLQWGRDTMTGSSSTITFPKAFSSTAWVVTNTPYSNTVTGSTPKPFGVTNITATTFDATALNSAGAASVLFGWIAIGPA